MSVCTHRETKTHLKAQHNIKARIELHLPASCLLITQSVHSALVPKPRIVKLMHHYVVLTHDETNPLPHQNTPDAKSGPQLYTNRHAEYIGAA